MAKNTAAHFRTARIRFLAVLLGLGLACVAGAPGTASSGSPFVQAQRVNSLTLQAGTDTFGTENAFGAAFTNLALTSLQTAFDQSVADGSTSWIFEMRDLSDLSGTSDPSFHVGVLTGVPLNTVGNPATYDGTADVDWWYVPSLANLDEDGFPEDELPATFSAATLDAGPGAITLPINLGGAPASLAISSARLRAVSDDSTAPLESANGLPPGHLPEEDLPGSLESFESMSSGQFAGRISAGSLANTQIPASITTNCTNYSNANTMLDLIVGGCTVIIIQVVKPTQPDTFDPAVGSGTYTFSTDVSRHVTGCTHNGQAATLDDCLDGAAYSVYFHFTTDRVIVHGPCTSGTYSADGDFPCTLADPGYFVDGYGSTTQTACPVGMTSVAAGSTSCDFFGTTTVGECAQAQVQIGVTTTCTATVANEIDGPVATGDVDWSHSSKGDFSVGSCVLVAPVDDASCSVEYTPGTAGNQELGADYSGDDEHGPSSDQIVLKVSKRASATTVTCKPKTVPHGKSTVCTAKVREKSAETFAVPTGKVKWSAPTRFGALSATSCRLATHNGVASCQVKFKTKSRARGKFSISATYAGDARHKGSSDKAQLTVS